MSSKQSVKRSPASRDCQENKGTAERYLDPAFIRALRAKAAGYLIGADQYKSSGKARFPKDIIKKPLFQAISYLRRRHKEEQNLAKDFPDILNEVLGPEDPEPAKLLTEAHIDAVRKGNIAGLNDVPTLCEIFERKIYGRQSEQTAERKRDLVPWHYYAAMAAFGFLKRGVIPTRAQVKEDALKERAIAEPPVIQEPGEPKEMRIDPEPAPEQQPESYYGAEQGEPTDDPSIDLAAKRDIPEKERLRILQWQRERIIEWQRQARAKSGTEEVKKPTEGNPLIKERDKQIGEKIKVLRQHQPNWKRIFKDLGLDQLRQK